MTQKNDWRLLGLVSGAHFISHVHLMTLPALVPLLPLHFNVTYLEIGFAITLFNVVSLFLQTPMGWIVDKWGSWRALVIALSLAGICFGLLAFTDRYIWLLIAALGAGAANTVYHPADYAILSNFKETSLGRAFSIHTFTGFFGTAVTPFTLLSVAAIFNIQGAFALAGGISIFVAVVILCSGSFQTERTQRRIIPPQAKTSQGKVFSPRILLLALLFAFLSLNTNGIQAFSVVSFVNGYQIDLTFANVVLTSFLFASAVGILAGGILAERVRRQGLFAARALVIAALLTVSIAFFQLGSITILIALTVVGLLNGVIIPSRDLLVRAASARGEEARTFGIVSTGSNLGGVVGPVVFGYLIDQKMYQSLFIAAALFMVASAILTIMSEKLQTPRKA